jgi:hypothetical protein
MGAPCSLTSSAADSTAVGARPKYSRARASKANSSPPLACHRKSTSMSSASLRASPMKSASPAASKRISTAVAFTLERLPWGASTWSEVTLSARIEPTLKSPSSS